MTKISETKKAVSGYKTSTRKPAKRGDKESMTSYNRRYRRVTSKIAKAILENPARKLDQLWRLNRIQTANSKRHPARQH